MDDDDLRAEAIQRGALRRMLAFVLVFGAWQLSYFTLFRPAGELVRAVDIVRTLGFLLWSAALLVLFASGGGALAPRRVRRILDDELAQARRAASYRHGFWAMIASAFAGYAATLAVPLRAADLAHILVSVGVLTVLVSQLLLERGSRD